MWAYQGTLNACIQILLIIGLGYCMAWRKLLTSEKFLPQVNVFMLLVSFPCINLYLVGITLDLRDAAGWKAMAAYILWIAIVQAGISIWVMAFGGRDGNEAAVLNLLLTANNTFIIGLPIMDATWGSRGRSLALLTGVPLFLQVFPYSIILFEQAQLSKARAAALEARDSPEVSPASDPGAHAGEATSTEGPGGRAVKVTFADQDANGVQAAAAGAVQHTVLEPAGVRQGRQTLLGVTVAAATDPAHEAQQSHQVEDQAVEPAARHAARDEQQDVHTLPSEQEAQRDAAVCATGSHQGSVNQGSVLVHVQQTTSQATSQLAASPRSSALDTGWTSREHSRPNGTGSPEESKGHNLGHVASVELEPHSTEHHVHMTGADPVSPSIDEQGRGWVRRMRASGLGKVCVRLRKAWRRSDATSLGFAPADAHGGLRHLRDAPSWGHQSSFRSFSFRSLSFRRKQPMHADVGWLFVWNRSLRRTGSRLPRSWSLTVRERLGDGLTGAKTRWLPLFITIIKNPVLVSLLVSCLISLSGLNQYLNPKSPHYVIELGWLVNALNMLASTTVPLALFSNGAFLYGKRFWEGNMLKVGGKRFWEGNMLKAVVVVLLKVVVLPPLQLACAKLLALETADAMALLLLSVCPCATTSFVLASQYKSGAEIITMATVVLTILLTPLMLVALRLPLLLNLYSFDTSKFPLP